MRRAAALVTAIAIVFSVTAPSIADGIPDEQWFQDAAPAPSPDTTPYWMLVADYHGDGARNALPRLAAYFSDTSTGRSLIDHIVQCTGADDPNCTGADYWSFEAVMPTCDGTTSVDCISALTATDSEGKPLNVQIVGAFPTDDPNWEADPKIGLPGGHSGILFTIDGVTHSAGNLFLAQAISKGSRQNANQRFNANDFRIYIDAVKRVGGNYEPFKFGWNQGQYRGMPTGWENGGGNAPQCAQANRSECLELYPLPLDISFGITVKLSNPLKGWMHGRISNASASVTSSAGVQTVTVSAKPVQVPTMYGEVQKANAPEEMKAFYANFKELGGRGSGCTDPSYALGACPANLWVSVTRSPGMDRLGMQEILLWLPLIKDTARVAPTAWFVKLMNYSDGESKQQCYSATDKLSGVVATNATAYISGPPTWDAATQSLDYKVAAPHFKPDGKTVFQGSYDLLLRSDVARCIYGFSSAPVKATVSVVSESGDAVAATTVVSEDNGWLRLRATGFTFSNPTVRVQLQQDKPAAAPGKSPAAKGTVAAKSITCTKGKLTKKVTAAKCPTGWKKK